MYFCEYFSKYTSDVYISDTTKAVICGSVLLFGIVYFSTRDSSDSLNEKKIDKLINDKYGIHTETDYSSLINFKLVNFRIKRGNTHIDSDETLLNLFHPHFRVLLSPEDHMIQELNGLLHCLLYDAKSIINFELSLFIFFSLTCISFINYYAILLTIEKQNFSISGLYREKVRKEALLRETLLREILPRETLLRETLLRETLLREILPREILTKEILTKETLTKETLTKETLTKETLAKEKLAKEKLRKQELLKKRYLDYKIKTRGAESSNMESIDRKLAAIKATNIELKRILSEKILLKKSTKK